MGRFAIGYVVVVNEHVDLVEFTRQVDELDPVVLLDTAGYGAVLVVSDLTHDCEPDDLWSLPDRDLSSLAQRFECLQGRYPNLGGRIIGSRWPVMWKQTDEQSFEPNEVDLTVNFEHLVLTKASRDQFVKVCAIVARLLSRYRSLVDAIADCQEALKGTAVDGDISLDSRTQERVLAARSTIARASVLSDPTPQIYWKFEATIIDELSHQWGLERVERSAHQVMSSTRQILEDQAARRLRVTMRQRNRQLTMVKAILAALSIFNLVSALLGLFEFATSESGMSLPSGTRLIITISLLTLTVAALLGLFSYSRKAALTDQGDLLDDALYT